MSSVNASTCAAARYRVRHHPERRINRSARLHRRFQLRHVGSGIIDVSPVAVSAGSIAAFGAAA